MQATHGELWWRRDHQLPGVLVCPEHACLLLDSTVSFSQFSRHEFVAATPKNCPSHARPAAPVVDHACLAHLHRVVRHLALGLAGLPRAHAISVRLKTDMATVRAELFEAICLFHPAGEEAMLYSQADDLPWYARQLARQSCDFEIIEPAALRQALRDCAMRLCRLTESEGNPYASHSYPYAKTKIP